MKRFTYEAGIYGALYIVIGVAGLLTLVFDPFLCDNLIKDPIESVVLILIAIVYFRGFLKLMNQDSSGLAFIFVAAIMGLLLGGISFLNFTINGLLKSTSEIWLFSVILNRIDEFFSLSIVLGSLSFIPFKDIKSFVVFSYFVISIISPG